MRMFNTLSVVILMQHMHMTLSLQIMSDFQGMKQLLVFVELFYHIDIRSITKFIASYDVFS